MNIFFCAIQLYSFKLQRINEVIFFICEIRHQITEYDFQFKNKFNSAAGGLR